MKMAEWQSRRSGRFAIWKRLKAVAYAAAVATPFAFVPAGAWAAPQSGETVVKFRGQDIYVRGNPIVKYLPDGSDGNTPDAELVLAYTNTASSAMALPPPPAPPTPPTPPTPDLPVNSLRLEQKFEARVLVVGGGGAGGYGTTTAANPAGGGGGGAVKELPNKSYEAATYSMTIGRGGAQSTAAGNGEDGYPTTFTTPSETIKMLGGGGGGSNKAGNGGETVATGGGGSGKDKPGGVGALGEKHKGGNATVNNRSGGGGGADGPGHDSDSDKGGDGGDGIKSDIASEIVGDMTGYGGGGGGAQSSNTSEDPCGLGVDGGGKGGRQGRQGGDGIPGTGGGGGGGGRAGTARIGGAGGSGVVIIRITKIYVELKWKSIDIDIPGLEKGTIFVDENAKYEWQGSGATKELLITYTNTFSDGGLRFFDPDHPELPPVWANARVLLVGGGGGGGMIDERSKYAGGGAGGGAGGFVEQKGLVFDNSVEFSVTVGKGGKGGAAEEEMGDNGTSSLLTTGGVNVVREAYGGGGGGAHGDGIGTNGTVKTIASGGGGSCSDKADASGKYSRTGGLGAQGGNGGDADEDALYVGGGGGGAGGTGGTAHQGTPGNGGDGKSSDITGEMSWYAGGGGGAFVNLADKTSNTKGGIGGSDVGGNGAGIWDGVPKKAEDGLDGRGGGGGGGVSYSGAPETAGKGGDGVVIIRLSGFVVSNVPVPGKWDEATGKYWGPTTNIYDGAWQVGVPDFFAYKFVTNKDDRTTWPVAIDADNYVVTVTMESGSPYYWADWKEGDPEEKKWGDRKIYWRINQLRVRAPENIKTFVYDATEHCSIDKDTYHLDDDGYLATDAGLKYCRLTPTYKATDAAKYEFKAQLVADYESMQNVTNFVWTNSSMQDRGYSWEITQAPNKIVWTSPYLSYLRSRLDTPAKPHHPSKHFNAAWGKETAKIEYRPVDTEGEEGWQDWPPAEKGSYTLRITIEKTPNWQGDSVSTDFGTWDKLADVFSDQMVVTAEGYNGGTANTLTDFPVPVRVHEPKTPGKGDGYEAFSGFSYARAGATGKELHFFDSNGDPIEHEVDTWNTHGESILWVRLPELKGNGTAGKTDGTAKGTTTLTMCWRRVSDILLPAYDPTAVWKKTYNGVWHFSQEEGGVWADSTGNGRSAYLNAGSKAKPIDGPMGKALYVEQGDLLADDWPYKVGTITNKFTYSGWYRNPDFVADGKVTGGYKMFAGTKLGASTTTDMNNMPGWCFRLNNNAYQMNWNTSPPNPQSWNWNWGTSAWNVKTTWGYLGYRAAYQKPRAPTTNATSKVVTYYGSGIGRYYAYADAFNKSETDNIAYHVDGSDKPLQLATVGFEVDEVRFTTNTLTQVWMEQEYRTLHIKNYCTYGLIKIDCDRYNNGNGLICDWWVTVPSLAKTVWREGDSWPTEVKGTYKGAATAIKATYQLIPGGTPTTTKPIAKGHYRATYDHSAPTSYRPQAHTIDFYIIEATVPVYDIGGNGGDSGRILLMNSDNRTMTMKGETYPCTVTNQGWCARSDAGVTYWKTLEGGEGTNNVMPGTWFDLVRSADTNVLWHLADCRQGNLFPTNDSQALTAAPWNSYCYLPASSATALSITNEDVKATRGSTGWILMRNIAKEAEQKGQGGMEGPGACVYSPCYSNGIGTVYFDAVNSLKALDDRAEAFKLVLEIATETDEGLPPFDTNCWYEVSGQTNRYGKLNGMWRPVEMSPMLVHTSTYTDQAVTNCLVLKETTGGRQDYFYRVHARVDVHKPCRFRIRRASVDETVPGPDGQPDPDDSYILLDNIIASFPPIVAELTPYGSFDRTLSGDRAVGYGGAFESPFPSAAEGASLTGRCAVAFTGDYTPSAESFSLKQMFYRWRYLGQLSDPEDGDWAATDLTEAGDELRTAQPLATPAEAGDVEFYFVTVLKTPYYGYVDYTGLNKPVWPPAKGGYTEEGLPHESRLERTDNRLVASGGTDWYVRLRDGIVRDETDRRYENLLLLTRPSGGGPVETNVFDIIGDNQLVARLRTRDPLAAGLDFRIEGLNPQTPGSRAYAFSTDRWKSDARVESFPSRVNLESCGADDWGWVACDGATGFLYLQLDFKSKALQIAHAEAENFEKWSSAVNPDGLFVGSAVDTNSSSAVTREWVLDWTQWSASIATDPSWQEGFLGAGAGSEWNKSFSTARSPLGWTVESALWTYGKWSQQAAASMTITVNDDVAAQLMGLGQGRVSFSGAAKVPDGLDTVSYRARVGQVNDFDDFTWYNWFLGTSFEDMWPTTLMTDYTVATIAALTESGAESYDGDGSVSLIGYYNDEFGCYEFRVSRGRNDKDLRLALFRWRKAGAGYVCDKLLDGTAATSKNYFDFNSDGKNPERGAARLVKTSKTLYGGLYLSVREQDGKTLISGGVCETDVSTMRGTESMSGEKFTCITYFDADNEKRLTKGTFGLTSCNCPGLFAKPICYRAGVQSVKPDKDNLLQAKTAQVVSFTGDKITGSGDESYYSRWKKLGRLVRASEHDWWGFQAAAPEEQTVKVQIAEHTKDSTGKSTGVGPWTDVYENTVSGFTDRPFQNIIRNPAECDVRLQVGEAKSSARTDVIVNDVSLTQWNGQWTPHWDDGTSPWRYLTNDFVYTSAWVLENSGRRSLKLQPTRAKDGSTPVSLRSPMMRGLGLIHFAWRDADPRAKIRVQYKENVTEDSLMNATKTLGEGGTDGWTTFATIPVGELGESGAQTVYLNRRYDGKDSRGRDYYFGLIRLVIDEDVQAEAISGDRRRTDPEYGAVTITDAFVWDFPEYDKFGWNGWNFRAAGWVTQDGSDPDTFANIRDSFHGLSGLLNNTLDADTLADREKGHYADRLPSVQSPAFRTNCVGALSFRARLYDADDQVLSGHPAVVSVYGNNRFDEKSGEPTGEWMWISDVEVSNRAYVVHSVKIPATLDCKAIRLAVKGVKGVTAAGTPKYEPILRVAVDDIVIWERLAQSVAFRKAYVRPFRDATAIKGTAVVQDIAEMVEQPLIGESFGFQAEVEVLDPDEVITGDPEHPITVDLAYYAGSDVWGYENWRTNPAAVTVAGLTPATDGNGLVFRSTVEQSASLCPPQLLKAGEGYRIVQYHVTAHYYVQGGSPGVHELQSSEWSMPAWNTGFKDPNGTNTAFSAFTLLEEIAPGRAWINEVNFTEATKAESKIDQWVEIAVPSGVDMSGWKLYLYDLEADRESGGDNHAGLVGSLMTFGKGCPSSKAESGDPSHYDFYLVKGPKTTKLSKADATWPSLTGGTVTDGVLDNYYPYGFELVRPTGVVEHRVVVQGFNYYKTEQGYKWYWPDYEGTNLVRKLDEKFNVDNWVWGEEDRYSVPGATVGVVTNQGMLHVEWKSPMGRTPGALNEGQYIDPNWFVHPNGGYCWITAIVKGLHMRQIIGKETNTVGSLTVQEGSTTSIVYEVDRWYGMGPWAVVPNERATMSGAAVGANRKLYYTLTLANVSNHLDVTASADVDARLKALGVDDANPYKNAIMKWLEEGDFAGDEIILPHYRGTTGELDIELGINDLYWLDLDPTKGGWELWGGMGEKGGTQNLGKVNEPVVRYNPDGSGRAHTNIQTTCWLMITNANDAAVAAYPPYRLQGLANEQSDDSAFSGSWTSETFKIVMMMATDDRSLTSQWHAMRQFVFDHGSFRPANDPEAPFATRIEVTDPFSKQSPAWELEWWRYADRGIKPFTSYRLNGEISPAGVSTLKKNDLLEY